MSFSVFLWLGAFKLPFGGGVVCVRVFWSADSRFLLVPLFLIKPFRCGCCVRIYDAWGLCWQNRKWKELQIWQIVICVAACISASFCRFFAVWVFQTFETGCSRPWNWVFQAFETGCSKRLKLGVPSVWNWVFQALKLGVPGLETGCFRLWNWVFQALKFFS